MSNPPKETKRPLGRTSRMGRWALGLAVVVVILFGVRDAVNGPGPVADDFAQYILHAQAIAEGRSYVDTGYLYSHLRWGAGPPLLVPGYPVTIASFYAVMGQRDWIPGALTVLAAALFVLIAGVYFQRRYGAWAGAFVGGMVALMIAQVHAAAAPGPDLFVCAFAWAIALALDDERKPTWGRVLLVVAATIAALTFRLAALPIIPALIAFGVFRLNRGGAKWVGVGLLAGVGFWWMYSVEGYGAVPVWPDYIRDAIERFAGNEGALREPLSKWAMLRGRLPELFWGVFDLELYPFPHKLANQAYHVLATGLVAIGGICWVRKGWASFALLFVGAYLAMLLLLNFGAARYLWPLAPAVAFAMWEGARTVRAVLPERVRPMGEFAAGALLAVSLFTVLRSPPPPPLIEHSDVAELMTLIERERQATPDMRVAFFKARTLALATGVPTAALFGHARDEVVLVEAETLGLTHVVVGSLFDESGPIVQQWGRIVTERPQQFTLMGSAGAFDLFRIDDHLEVEAPGSP